VLCGARAPPAEALRDLQQACTNLQLGREALARRAPFTRPALARLASSVALAGGQHLWARLPGGGAARDAGARKRAPSPGAGAREQKRVRCADGAETRPVSTGGWDETCPVSTGGRDETCPVSTGGRGLGGALAAAPGGWAVRFEGAGGAGLLRLARETHRNYGTCLNRSHEARTGDDVAARRRRALVGELAGGRAGALVEMCRAAAGAAEAEAEAEAALALCIEVLARIGADEAGGGGVAGAVGGAEPHADPLEVWAECLLVLGARRAAAGAEVLAGEAARMARHAGDAAGRAGDLGGGALGGDGGALLRAAAALARVPCGAGEGRAWWVAVEEAARGAGRASPGAVCRVLGALLREAAEGDSDGWAAAGARAVSRARGSSLGDGLRAAHGAAPGAMALWWFRRLRAGGAASAAGAGALLAALQLLPPGDARAVVGALRARSLAVPPPPSLLLPLPVSLLYTHSLPRARVQAPAATRAAAALRTLLSAAPPPPGASASEAGPRDASEAGPDDDMVAAMVLCYPFSLLPAAPSGGGGGGGGGAVPRAEPLPAVRAALAGGVGTGGPGAGFRALRALQQGELWGAGARAAAVRAVRCGALRLRASNLHALAAADPRAVEEALGAGEGGPALVALTQASPPPRTKWTRRVPHPVLIGHAALPP
jgi:hypothetical protein